jgi:hypothetical protein
MGLSLAVSLLLWLFTALYIFESVNTAKYSYKHDLAENRYGAVPKHSENTVSISLIFLCSGMPCYSQKGWGLPLWLLLIFVKVTIVCVPMLFSDTLKKF